MSLSDAIIDEKWKQHILKQTGELSAYLIEKNAPIVPIVPIVEKPVIKKKPKVVKKEPKKAVRSVISLLMTAVEDTGLVQ